jgi:hypothetical protein
MSMNLRLPFNWPLNTASHPAARQLGVEASGVLRKQRRLHTTEGYASGRHGQVSIASRISGGAFGLVVRRYPLPDGV